MQAPSPSEPPGNYDLVPADSPPPPPEPTRLRRVEHEEIHTHDPSGLERHERVVRDETGLEHREESLRHRAVERWLLLTKLEQLIWLIVGLVEGLIALRIVLKVIAANPQSPFAELVYGLSGFFLAPFFGLTASPVVGRSVLEIPAIIAMGVYALLSWALVRIVWLVLAPTTARTQSTYDRYRA